MDASRFDRLAKRLGGRPLSRHDRVAAGPRRAERPEIRARRGIDDGVVG